MEMYVFWGFFYEKKKEREKQNNTQYYGMTPCASGRTVVH